ncbi:unnamed protein product [Cyprideis torosa]|uniref:DnaJ homolog l(2)tid, mitochondrial n=1 Tax=Cyprideis torosa TaxID=163714 RepID=A0A7R8ZJM4_9CRUS|nr:unnamed protein product [Cyprideis torosa]CAG0887397.1 unnamed protein product [Cyprideis torosa]
MFLVPSIALRGCGGTLTCSGTTSFLGRSVVSAVESAVGKSHHYSTLFQNPALKDHGSLYRSSRWSSCKPLLSLVSSTTSHRYFNTSTTTFQRKNYYEILGVSRNASSKDIKKAYYELAKKYHPDTNKGDPSVAGKFQAVSEAYEVLSDETKRKEYDQWGTTSEEMGRQGGGPHPGAAGFGGRTTQWNFTSQIDPEELFRRIFGQAGFEMGAQEDYAGSQFGFGASEEFYIDEDDLDFLEAFFFPSGQGRQQYYDLDLDESSSRSGRGKRRRPREADDPFSDHEWSDDPFLNDEWSDDPFSKSRPERGKKKKKGKKGVAEQGFPKKISVQLSFLEAARGCNKGVSVNVIDVCPKCNGNRAEPGTKAVRCPNCHGTGMETISTGPFVMRSTCRQCHGTRMYIRYPCMECEGKGSTVQKRSIKVPIPAGIQDGQTIRMPVGKKEVFLTVRVSQSDYYKRDGADIHTTNAISIAQAALGGTLPVEGIYEQLYIKVPPGSSSHDRIRLTGKGLKRVNSYGQGDHYIHLKIKVPRKLTREQEALLHAFAETETGVQGTVNSVNITSTGEKKSAHSGDKLKAIRRALYGDTEDFEEDAG